MGSRPFSPNEGKVCGEAWVQGQRKMSQVLGMFGLLGLTMLWPDLAWRIFWKLWTIYFFNFNFFFLGHSKLQIPTHQTLNQWIWVHDWIVNCSDIWTEYSCCCIFSIWSKRRRLVSFVRTQYLPVSRLPTFRNRVQVCKRFEHTHSDFSLGQCEKFKNKLWYHMVIHFEQEASMFQSLVIFCYTVSHFSYSSVITFWYKLWKFLCKDINGVQFCVYLQVLYHVQNCMVGFSEIVWVSYTAWHWVTI
jgi:hypothetical protein